MKKIVYFSLFCAFLITGCSPLHSLMRPAPAKIEPLPSYSGPRAKIIVADFEIKTPKAISENAAGLKEMLVAALKKSNRFEIIPPQEQADLIISTTITEFDPQISGGRAGVGGGGGAGSGVLGGLLGNTLNKAYMALEIRLAATATSEVLASTQIQGQASDLAVNFKDNSWDLAKGLTGYTNTPMEKTIRICLIETVRYISQAIPDNYYKY